MCVCARAAAGARIARRRPSRECAHCVPLVHSHLPPPLLTYTAHYWAQLSQAHRAAAAALLPPARLYARACPTRALGMGANSAPATRAPEPGGLPLSFNFRSIHTDKLLCLRALAQPPVCLVGPAIWPRKAAADDLRGACGTNLQTSSPLQHLLAASSVGQVFRHVDKCAGLFEALIDCAPKGERARGGASERASVAGGGLDATKAGRTQLRLQRHFVARREL